MGCPPAHLMQVATWTMLLYELVVGVFALLGVDDVYYLTPTDMLIFYAVAAGIYALLCVAVSVLARGDPTDFVRTFVGGFFALGLVLSVVRAVLAGVWLAKFGGLSPLSFTVNADAFAVYRSTLTVDLAVFAVIVTYVVASLRLNYLSRLVERHQRAFVKQGTFVGAPFAAGAASALPQAAAAAAVTPGEPRPPRVLPPPQVAAPRPSARSVGAGAGGGFGGLLASAMDAYGGGSPPPVAAAAPAAESRRPAPTHAAVADGASPVYESD